MKDVKINFGWKESVVLEMTLLQCREALEHTNVQHDRDSILVNINSCLKYLNEKLEEIQ